VTERNPGHPKVARETTRDGSRQKAGFTGLSGGASGLATAITVAGLLAALLMAVTEFSTVAKVNVQGGSCQVIEDTEPDLADRCVLSGFERNGGAFLALAVLAALMAWGAGLGGSRPAAMALVLVGVFVLGWALLVDLPVTNDTGALGTTFEGASGSAGPGLAIEIVAGVLALAAGAFRLLAPAGATTTPPGRTPTRTRSAGGRGAAPAGRRPAASRRTGAEPRRRPPRE